MSRTSTVILWIAVVLMTGVYFLPLWSISLDAPQYPEGMGMNIWLTKITGEEPHDLQNINGLNHYIGMKEIHAESIPELRYMKYIMLGLIALGILAAALRRKRVLAIFVVVAIALAVVGLADFYRWSYDYGHDLNPDAPIKVPGMTYQPPLIGSKVLLNITATSLPGLGGLMLMIAVAASTLVLFFETRRARRASRTKPASRKHQKPAAAVVALLAIILAGCSIEPKPIEYGVDNCAFCRMTIADQKYGAEAITKKGKIYKYDALECMVNDMQRGGLVEAEFHSLLTVDFTQPTTLIDATTAVYLQSDQLRSPMAVNLTSFSDDQSARDARKRYNGSVMAWGEVLEFVDQIADQGVHSQQ